MIRKNAGRTAEDILEDIRTVGREARADGDIKTALKTYELEGKHLGMFTDKVELTGKIDVSAKLEEARNRVARYQKEQHSA